MNMAVINIVKLAELEGTTRFDAEYYQPYHLELIEKIKKADNYKIIRHLGCQVVSGPFGSSLKSDAYKDSGVPFVRIQNLENFFINDDELVYISKEDNDRLKSSQLKLGDLVFSKVGNTIGVVSMITEDISNCNISENNIGIKFFPNVNTKLKIFVLTFLNSELGQRQILRRISGNAQPKLNIADIYNLLIYVPENSLLEKINEIVLEAKKLLDQSKTLYLQAEHLLLEESGLKDFEPKYELSYNSNLSRAFGMNRLDAEYFQPLYHDLIKYLEKNIELKPLRNFLLKLQKGIEVGGDNYREEGKPFIRVSNLSINGFVEKDQKLIEEKIYGRLKDVYEPKLGDLLLTKDATPGIAYVVKESVEGIISSGTLKLTINEGDINKEYLSLCINSIVGKLQIERDGGGSVITHWRPEQIKKLQIPILPERIQKKIASLVQNSHEARRKAKSLLEEAKGKVEEAIDTSSPDSRLF